MTSIFKHKDITQNKYFKLYMKIVSSGYDETQYNENHHILPESMGGDNSKANITRVSARKHFICHYLLTKFTTSNSHKGMLWAFIMMKGSRNYQQRYINSKLYEATKIKFVEEMRNQTPHNKGKTYDEIYGIERSTEIKDKKRKSMLGKSINKGKTHSEETKHKISLAHIGKTHSEETKLKIGLSQKGIKKPSITGANNYQFSGYWFTPYGKFTSSKIASETLNINKKSLRNWCKNSDTKITNYTYSRSKIISNLGKRIEIVGKSFKDVGFYYGYHQ